MPINLRQKIPLKAIQEWDRLINGLPIDGFGRVVLGISRSSPSILYTLIADGKDKFINFIGQLTTQILGNK